MDVLPMMPKHWKLTVLKKTSKQFQTVKKLLLRNDIKDVIIATDAGREGELVARWILQMSGNKKPIYRLWISSVTDKAIKDQAEEIFNELGLNMTTAVNMFLRTAIREHGIPFELKLEVPNDTTATAIEEGRKMMKDPSAPRYSSMDALKAALDV